MSHPHKLLPSLEAKLNEINIISIRIGKRNGSFNVSQALKPEYTDVEAGFIRTISWLYTIYRESAKFDIDFLIDKFHVYSLNPLHGKQFRDLINAQRTYLQHTLNLEKSRDRETKNRAESWFYSHIGRTCPKFKQEWNTCLENLMSETLQNFDNLLCCVREIERDKFCTDIVNQWNLYCENTHFSHEFDQIIFEAADSIGINWLDIVRYREKNYQKWMSILNDYQPGYNFAQVAKKIVLRTIADTKTLVPLYPEEIAEVLALPKGKQLIRAFNLAVTLFEYDPCDKDELLDRLKAHIAVNGLP